MNNIISIKMREENTPEIEEKKVYEEFFLDPANKSQKMNYILRERYERRKKKKS